MYIHRQLEKEIAPFLKKKEVIAVIGPRQSGKTTFIQNLEKELESQKNKVLFITFEKKSDLDLFQASIDDFKDLISKYDYVIIDEFQYAKDGGQKLKYLYDATQIKFIISGSSSLELTFKTGKYMVGRMLSFKLAPFSFREFLSFENKELSGLLEGRINSNSFLKFNVKNSFGQEINRRLNKSLEKYVIYGGYPAVVLSATNQEKEKILEGIMETYLLKDIKSLLNLASEGGLVKLSRFLAAQIGNIVKYEELSNASGLDYREVIKHLNILESTFIVKLIKPFFTNRRTELVKNPKNYFIDLGLRNYLLNDFRSLESRNDLGAVMENYGFNLLQKLELARDLKYWRTKSKAEVDFIIEKEQKVFPIEIKYSSKPVIGKSLHSFIEKFNPPQAVILTKDYLGEKKVKKTKVKFIPLSYF
ncbi:ATP-binding protein [Patescibacteria group bacterium]|nr:ATP-binding protein [Patescibacteria group bacterium]MBU4512335.1 ATP-binding protein [Patescibacteria group bacterium]MCG2692545.1 ATP-binding protein [Candidatus Parcubacteria bacterium]